MPLTRYRSGLRTVAVLLAALCAFASALAAPDPLAPYQPPAAPKPADWPRERLVQFMNELVDYVYKNHVVTDPARAVYGMTYEFARDGHPTQTFTLDAMHDGAWFMSALATAQRAVPEGKYLEKIQTYQVPFYTNMLNHSDRLFPAMKPGGEDKKPFTHPVKGWVPRGWDDGLGYDRATARPFGKPGYDVASNHLAQDLADALLNVWLTTHDPAVAEAIANLQQYRHDSFGDIPVVAHAAGVTGGRPELAKMYKFADFQPRQAGAAYTGLFAGGAVGIPAYCDDLAWEYGAAIANYQKSGEQPTSTALHAAAALLGQMECMEFFCDDAPWRYGFCGFDLQGPVRTVPGEGRLSLYQSVGKTKSFLYGGRGIQFAWVGAGVLPTLKNHPRLWEENQHRHLALDDVATVYISDDPPMINGRLNKDCLRGTRIIGLINEIYTLQLMSDPQNFYLVLRLSQLKKPLEITITPAVPGLPGCRLQIAEDGKIKLANGVGKPMLYKMNALPQGNTPHSRMVEIRIPYSAVSGQAPWMNGVEFGQFRLKINDEPERLALMLSDYQRMTRRLEEQVLGTIENWHQVWQERGVIPSAWHGPGKPTHAWEISDAGNYAHLIRTIALWLIYQQRTSEWELIKKQTPAAPLPCQALPASVLKAQGLAE